MLKIPQAFLNGFSGNTSSIYPIVVLKIGDNVIRLSQVKGVFDGEYYEDRGLKVNSIREKIDIQDKKFQVNNVKVIVSNYIVNQIRFSEKFKNFSFSNAIVEIYYANKSCKTLDDCLLIFKGFVKSYEGNNSTVSFHVEDHSQYTLDKKTFPKYSTTDIEAETIEESKDAYFPVVYGHVDKSPVIFSKGARGTVFSNIFPDAIMYGVNIEGIEETESPLMVYKENIYLSVPEVFKRLTSQYTPDEFLINGFNYSEYVGTTQYSFPEPSNRNYIQLEKKSTDFSATSLLPLSITSRDQFQVEATRKVTGVNADSSADIGDDNGYITYGGSDIRYLGKSDGYEAYGEDNKWMFPKPTSQQKLGYYQDFVISGLFYCTWELSASDQANNPGRILYGYTSAIPWAISMNYSAAPVGDIKGPDVYWLPFNEGRGNTELIQYFREEFIEQYNITEINWAKQSRVVGHGIGLWNTHTWAYYAGRTTLLGDSFPDFNLFGGHTPGTYGDMDRDILMTDYLWGVELRDSSGDVVFYIHLDAERLGYPDEKNDEDDYNYTGPLLSSVVKPEVYAWITEIDAYFDGGNETYSTLIPDTVINLKKLLWGRKATFSESIVAASGEYDEDGNVISSGFAINRGSNIYGLYPCMSFCVPKSSNQRQYYVKQTQGSNDSNGMSSYDTWKMRDYELVVDCLSSFKNPYLQNPENPIAEGDNWQTILKSIEAFDYSLLETPSWKNRFVVGKHRFDYSYQRTRYEFGRLAFYGNETNSWRESGGHWKYAASNTKKRSSGIEAKSGGNYVSLVNASGTKDVVKLDLTFQSLSGDDIVLGGVFSKIRGKVSLDAFKYASTESFSGGRPALRIECDALYRLDDQIIKVDEDDFPNGVFGMPDTEVDQDGNPTSEPSFFVTGTNTHTGDIVGSNDLVPIEIDSDVVLAETGIDDGDPLYINTWCSVNANENPDEDQWKQNVNSVNNLSIYFHIDETILIAGEEPAIETTTAIGFRTRIENFSLNQRIIIGNASNQKYFCDVRGRVDDQNGRYTGVENLSNPELIKSPSDILMHILEKELGYFNENPFDQKSIENSRLNHSNWEFGFTVSEETDAKDFLQDFSKSTKLIPRFRHDGTFGFIDIFQNYTESDIVINSSDVSNFKYSKTPISDIKLMVRVKYMYDYGDEKYKEATNLSNDGAVPVDFQEMLDMYGINNLTDAYLEVESKYIRDSNTAMLLRNHLLEWHKNQHNIIECTLPPKYMHLECGDIVEFDSLIEDLTIFGEDYTKDYKIGGLNSNQTALPFFMVEDINKSQKNVKIKFIQLHKFNIANILNNSPNYLLGDFYSPIEEFPEEDIFGVESILLGDVNFDGNVDVADIVEIVGIIIGQVVNEDIDQYSSMAADIDQDGYITVYDIIELALAIMNNEDLGEIEV